MRARRESRRTGAAPGSRSAAVRDSRSRRRWTRKGRVRSDDTHDERSAASWPGLAAATRGGRRSGRRRSRAARGRQPRIRLRAPAAAGLSAPSLCCRTGRALATGCFLLDDRSREYLLAHIEALPDPPDAWQRVGDAVGQPARSAHHAGGVLRHGDLRALPVETDEQNVERILAYLVRTFWRFLPHGRTGACAVPRSRRCCRSGLDRAPTTSQKATWFNALRDTALTPASLEWLERVWRRRRRCPACRSRSRMRSRWRSNWRFATSRRRAEILQQQHDRTQNPDRKARFAFVMPALSSDPAVREKAFERFRDVQNRRREPWVVESLRYLNHPLREAHAFRFVRPALDLLREVQRTGDIFFPTRWTEVDAVGPSQSRRRRRRYDGFSPAIRSCRSGFNGRCWSPPTSCSAPLGSRRSRSRALAGVRRLGADRARPRMPGLKPRPACAQRPKDDQVPGKRCQHHDGRQPDERRVRHPRVEVRVAKVADPRRAPEWQPSRR